MVNTLKQHDHIIITNNGVGEAVLIGINDFAKYEEFLHLRYVHNELQKTKEKADQPEEQFISAATVFANIDKKLTSYGL
jgi:PHD/YefM family antitoxin component YafN of YafNO toxin-antitoxin module